MNKKALLLTFCVASMHASQAPENNSSSSSTATNQPTKLNEEKLFEINGKKNYMLDHILQAHLVPNDPFSTTDIVRCTDKSFTLVGDVSTLQESDLYEIASGNFVYTPFYAMKKTRLSYGSYANIGAIIVGTQDEKKGQDLHFASMRNLLAQNKIEKEKYDSQKKN